MNFGTFIAVVLFANAAGAAVFVVLAGVALGLPTRRLWVPNAALFDCGFILAPSLYWARLSRDRPKSCAMRFAIAMFLYIQSVMLALGFCATRLGTLSQTEVVYDYAPFMELFSAIVTVLIYVVARQILKAPPDGRI